MTGQQQGFKLSVERNGLSNHALHHTAGTLDYVHTGDLRAVQDFLGHADPRMTAKCAHVVAKAKKNPALFIPVKVGVQATNGTQTCEERKHCRCILRRG